MCQVVVSSISRRERHRERLAVQSQDRVAVGAADDHDQDHRQTERPQRSLAGVQQGTCHSLSCPACAAPPRSICPALIAPPPGASRRTRVATTVRGDELTLISAFAAGSAAPARAGDIAAVPVGLTRPVSRSHAAVVESVRRSWIIYGLVIYGEPEPTRRPDRRRAPRQRLPPDHGRQRKPLSHNGRARRSGFARRDQVDSARRDSSALQRPRGAPRARAQRSTTAQAVRRAAPDGAPGPAVQPSAPRQRQSAQARAQGAPDTAAAHRRAAQERAAPPLQP